MPEDDPNPAAPDAPRQSKRGLSPRQMRKLVEKVEQLILRDMRLARASDAPPAKGRRIPHAG